jgi:hypothetical protein
VEHSVVEIRQGAHSALVLARLTTPDCKERLCLQVFRGAWITLNDQKYTRDLELGTARVGYCY